MNKATLMQTNESANITLSGDGVSDDYQLRAYLRVSGELVSFVEEEVLPDAGISAAAFWKGLAVLASRFTPRNRELLQRREELQEAIDLSLIHI